MLGIHLPSARGSARPVGVSEREALLVAKGRKIARKSYPLISPATFPRPRTSGAPRPLPVALPVALRTTGPGRAAPIHRNVREEALLADDSGVSFGGKLFVITSESRWSEGLAALMRLMACARSEFIYDSEF